MPDPNICLSYREGGSCVDYAGRGPSTQAIVVLWITLASGYNGLIDSRDLADPGMILSMGLPFL
jgi:hypothetical protein